MAVQTERKTGVISGAVSPRGQIGVCDGVVRGDAMTQAEWLTCASPMPMLDRLGDKATPRKLRLYLCAWRAPSVGADD